MAVAANRAHRWHDWNVGRRNLSAGVRWVVGVIGPGRRQTSGPGKGIIGRWRWDFYGHQNCRFGREGDGAAPVQCERGVGASGQLGSSTSESEGCCSSIAERPVAAQLEVGRKTTGERASIGPKRPRGPAWRGGKLKKMERASWAKKLLWAKVEFGMARENRNVLQFFSFQQIWIWNTSFNSNQIHLNSNEFKYLTKTKVWNFWIKMILKHNSKFKSRRFLEMRLFGVSFQNYSFGSKSNLNRISTKSSAFHSNNKSRAIHQHKNKCIAA
jgi:hypothetical protein